MEARRMGVRRAAVLRAAEFTYPEVGGTREGAHPGGYRTFERTVPLPSLAQFDAARHDLFSWAVQQRAGIRVSASGEVGLATVAALWLGVGPLGVSAPCRVVYVIDEPERAGFAYGTLPGHPESGEESFFLARGADGAISFTVRAFSRPATALTRLAGPIGHRVQDVLTNRYLRAFG